MKNVYERQNSKCRNAETVETVGSEFPADLTTGQHPLMMMMMMICMSIEVYCFEVLKSVCFVSWMVKFPSSKSCAEFPKGRIANTHVRFKECS